MTVNGINTRILYNHCATPSRPSSRSGSLDHRQERATREGNDCIRNVRRPQAYFIGGRSLGLLHPGAHCLSRQPENMFFRNSFQFTSIDIRTLKSYSDLRTNLCTHQ